MIELPKDKGREILRVEVGLTLHGTGLGVALEDHDEMGIFVEWPRSTIGLHTVEHYDFRTAADGERSKPGDTDLICYSLRKWARLAAKGNPSTLLPLFAPNDKVIDVSPLGEELRKNAWWFASKRSGVAFLGYMERQRQRMVGQRGRAGRVRTLPDGEMPDWKYAMHMLRLGYQGIEFLETGRITLPIPGKVGDFLRLVRTGGVNFTEVVHRAELLERRMQELLDGDSPLPEQPRSEEIERFVIDAHLIAWGVDQIVRSEW